MNDIKENLEAIRASIPEGVLLVAVTKTRSVDEINEAIQLGVTDIGENKVQEILEKFEKVSTVRWHLIGHLQTNKVKQIIDKVYMIHSVDSFHLAAEINKRAEQAGIMMRILIQVNAAEEESKFGIPSGDTEALISDILDQCPQLMIQGLMFIAPFDDPQNVRGYFSDVKRQFEQLKKIKHPRLDFQVLSMGMSNDYEVAIEEGANLVRVGSAIFGTRNY
jgi:pyridoxal phosphate enzyme (YggS family)